VGTSESGAQPPVGRTKIFSDGPKWTWTFANFFLHWTFSARVAPSVGLRPSSLQLQIHRSGIQQFQGFTSLIHQSDSAVGFTGAPGAPDWRPTRGWAPQNLARSPRSGALKYFPMDQNGLGLLRTFFSIGLFRPGGTLGRASAERPSATNSPVWDSPVGFTGRIHRSDSPVRPARPIGGRPGGGHLRIWRAAPGRAH
jgi:hypothetical protein